MLKANAGKIVPTTIAGSLPRPSWYTENLGLKSFLEAMVETRFREQYEDTLAVYLNEQTIAGLDIVTDGDCRFTQDIGGQSWTSYPPFHMAGFDRIPKMAPIGGGGIGFPRGHILHDYIEARLMPSIVGPIGRGNMQYAQIWKAAQRMTDKPVKFGTVTPEQALDVDAIAAQIIPTDDTPGAREARVVSFVDKALATWAAPLREPFAGGLDALNAEVERRWPGTGRFAALAPPRQTELLRGQEQTPFFQQMRFATIAGMFSLPAYGGNADRIGWRLIGFDDRHSWQPPFGDYDAEVSRGGE